MAHAERIAVVGASVRAAAASAVRAGFQPLAADRFGDDDLVRIAPTTRVTDYPQGLLGWLEQLAPQPAAWMYTGALENHPGLVDTMAAECPLWGNPGPVLRAVRSPWRLAETLGAAGLLFPETRRSPAGLPPAGSWLVKTGRGAGGIGVKQLKDDHRPSGLQGVVYQRRVAGDPAAAVFVAVGGAAKLLGVVHQLVGQDWLGTGEFQYCGAIGPFPCADTTLAEIERIGNALADRFGLIGLFGVDLIIDGHRVWTIEVNPRYTASVEVVERAAGVHAVAAHVEACRQKRLVFGQISRAAETYGKAILFAKRRVVVSENFADWASRESQAANWPTVADLSPAGTIVDAGHPVMTIFASGATAGDVENRLRDRVAEIERALYCK
jgi:predicted ATP-grasp superfamily ATP-dependent carboligase